jgi:tetratricopeptide (TPR) repeat protein
MRTTPLVLLLFAWTAPLLAQPSKGKPSEAERKKIERASELFREGEILYNIQKYEEALQKYEEAYLVSGEPDLLYNIGQCYRLMGKRQEAITSYRNFLRARPTTPMRASTESFIVTLENEPEPTTEPTTEPTPAPKPLPPEGFFARLVPEEPRVSPRAWFLSAAALGAGAAVLGSLSLQSAQEAGAPVSPDEDFNQDQDFFVKRDALKDRALSLALAADAVGVVAVGLGAYGWLVARHEKRRARQATLQASPGALRLSVRF